MWVKAVFLATLVVAAIANQQLWSEFKVKHNKTYSSEREHQLRYTIFNQNLAKINEHNIKYEQGLTSWYLAVNQFTDMTEKEFTDMLTASSFNNSMPKPTKIHVNSLEIPDSIDWRTKGVVTGVKDQGNCGSCWTFSATGTLEGQYALKHNKLVSLSEQNILDCCTSHSGYSGDGCSGGVVQSALDYVRDHGVASESDYPYKSSQKSCQSKGIVVKSKSYTEINANSENDLKNAVGSKGPVSVALNADKLQNYGGGIFSDTTCSHSIDHGVLVVGYGKQNEKNYWIIKNSWGASWGEKGYFRMEIGHNLCSIAQQACYPNL